MKAFALLLLTAAAALAQVPAHSVVGSLTMDIADLTFPVPYGQAEAKAVISVCDTQEAQRFQITINAQEASGNTFGLYFDIPVNKVGPLFCASVVATVSRADIPAVDVQRITHFAAAPPGATTSLATKVRK